MYYYTLKCLLYSPDKTNLPNDFFGIFPKSVDTESTKHLENYKHNTNSKALSSLRRRSSQPPQASQQKHVPPTPIHINKPYKHHSLEGQIDFRFGPINLSLIDIVTTKNHKNKRQIHESSLSLGYGVLHLYRELQPIPEQDLPDTRIVQEASLDNSNNDSDDGKILCILAIPSYMAQKDFITFLGSTNANILCYRFIRDYSPNKYTVLLKFKSRQSAFACYQKFNGRRFNMTEPEISHVVYIKSNTIDVNTMLPNTYPYLNETLSQDLSSHQQQEAELPTCPVCLERMDQGITGLLSIQCQHTNRCDCLNKWGKSSCPVCLYSQKPVLSSSSSSSSSNQEKHISYECFECESTESLWICMICGHIGCGRYQEAHAYDHYMETNHLYTLEIETQRIWDYLGDSYVHRLIQNTVDGALVELPPKTAIDQNKKESRTSFSHTKNRKSSNYHDYFSHFTAAGSSTTATENPLDREEDATTNKLDAMSVEYSFMLTSQLDSQRMYYEEQLDTLMSELQNLSSQVQLTKEEMKGAKEKTIVLTKRGKSLDSEINELQREKEKITKRATSFKDKYEHTLKNLSEEKLLTKSLMRNNELLKKNAAEKEATFETLTDKVRDLMCFLETKETMPNET
ncbi:uncharacterized protein B0P05DRAFT_590566 [Gilbertella persicaria]|uniref:uncharacterized protein n=1 Tax=Gilbertella persicaria TaxID=101096 RepID=UPI0022202CA0|nr:uncharacterized protein B0P05DRAFT_590566 [Gilbertella persicaria]KAI8061818.1 hypothetical protein B0P05DRAFT_590566 [Gilbertella persicaria]